MDGWIEEDGKWKQRWKEIIIFTTHRYDVLSRWVGKRFFSTLPVKLNRIYNRKWNARSFFFPEVYFSARLPVHRRKNVLEWITSRLNSWNKGTYYRFVKEYYGTASDFLGISHGTRNWEQHHSNFPINILHRKVHEAV